MNLLEVHSLSPRSPSLVPADRASQVLRDGAIREPMNTVLHLGLRYFGMEVATFSEAAGDALIVHGRKTEEDEPPPSLIGPPGVVTRDVVAVSDATASTSVHARRLRVLGDGSYIGSPIVIDGRTVAVLEFTSRKTRSSFGDGDVEMITSLARWLESELVQATLAESAKMPRARANQSPQFIASMSKELRSPISSLLGLSRAMKQENLGPLTEDQKRALDAVHESGRHLLSIVNDILELAKIESGELSLAVTNCDVQRVCLAAMDAVKEQAERKGVKIVAAFDSKAVTVRADEQRIGQMISTMLANAVRLSPEKTRIGFEVFADAENDAIRFDVSDQGTPISDEDFTKIFSPFAEADATLSQPCAGIGVGISLVHRLADLHGGGLTAERREAGNRFSVGIPNRTTESKPISSRTSWQNLLIMVVDDSAALETTETCMRARGHRILTASTYEEARDLSSMFRPDVLILNADGENGSGLTLIRAFRGAQGSALAEIPIIASTSLSLPGDREKFHKAGATNYVTRPNAMRTIASLVEKVTPFLAVG